MCWIRALYYYYGIKAHDEEEKETGSRDLSNVMFPDIRDGKPCGDGFFLKKI